MTSKASFCCRKTKLPTRLSLTAVAPATSIVASTAAVVVTRSVLARFGFVYLKLTAIIILAVEFSDRTFAVFFRRHFDKTKAARPAGFPVF